MSYQMLSSEELDVTVSTSLADLEKTLMQVKSLRYQIYSKYLSEKLSFEGQIRKLENELISSNFSSKQSTQVLSLNDLCTPRTPLGERSGNLSHISTQTTEDKGIQTNPHFSIPNLNSCEKAREGNSRVVKPRYDENLFNIVEQLEYLIKP